MVLLKPIIEFVIPMEIEIEKKNPNEPYSKAFLGKHSFFLFRIWNGL